MQKFIHCILSILFSICVIQCSTTTNVHIAYDPPRSLPSNILLAGASKVDITPPPGMPLAGYSSNAYFAKGFRTRLYARVIYLKSDNVAIALVQCDLLSGSSLVQKKVAQLVSHSTDVLYTGIVMAGTHTHSGPGNYFESNFYNRFASNASGFNEEYFTFLCNQIATAIIQAYTTRKPAMIAYGTKTLYGFTRNRSFNAYKANTNNCALNPLKAVNPTMHMIRVDTLVEGKQKPLAAFTVFSIHGTTVPDSNTLYSADVFAYIERELEWEMQRHGVNQFVHAVCNGSHADNAPNILKGKQGFEESRSFPLPIIPIVISCSNGYTGYCTTPQEYSMQHYEGGHTLYGPNTQPFLALHYAQLTATIANKMGDSNWSKIYSLKSASFLKKYPLPTNPVRKVVKQPYYVINPGIDEPYVSFLWEDVPPDQLEFHKPIVAIEYLVHGSFKPFTQIGIPIDDTGYDIAVIFTGTITKDGMAIYEARWYNPPLNTNYHFRFVILPRENLHTLYSEQFSW